MRPGQWIYYLMPYPPVLNSILYYCILPIVVEVIVTKSAILWIINKSKTAYFIDAPCCNSRIIFYLNFCGTRVEKFSTKYSIEPSYVFQEIFTRLQVIVTYQ